MIDEFVRNRISEIIQKSKLSERECALDLGFSHSYFSSMHNKNSTPSYSGLDLFCRKFKITVSEFFAPYNPEVQSQKDMYLSIIGKIDAETMSVLLDLIEKDILDSNLIKQILDSYEKYHNSKK